MAAPYTQSDVAAGYGAEVAVNSETTKIETAFGTVLNKDDATDNAMNVDLDMNGNAILNVSGLSIKLETYTVATLPSAAANPQTLVYVSDGYEGGAGIAVSTGTTWNIVGVGAEVSLGSGGGVWKEEVHEIVTATTQLDGDSYGKLYLVSGNGVFLNLPNIADRVVDNRIRVSFVGDDADSNTCLSTGPNFFQIEGFSGSPAATVYYEKGYIYNFICVDTSANGTWIWYREAVPSSGIVFLDGSSTMTGTLEIDEGANSSIKLRGSTDGAQVQGGNSGFVVLPTNGSGTVTGGPMIIATPTSVHLQYASSSKIETLTDGAIVHDRLYLDGSGITPVASNEVASKQYVDAVAAGIGTTTVIPVTTGYTSANTQTLVATAAVTSGELYVIDFIIGGNMNSAVGGEELTALLEYPSTSQLHYSGQTTDSAGANAVTSLSVTSQFDVVMQTGFDYKSHVSARATLLAASSGNVNLKVTYNGVSTYEILGGYFSIRKIS